MASNLLSRLLPTQDGSPSIYETLRRDEESDNTDVEERAGLVAQARNPEGSRYDLDAGLASALNAHASASSPRSPDRKRSRSRKERDRKAKKSPWIPGFSNRHEEDEDDVPLSLLIEEDELSPPSPRHHQHHSANKIHRPFRLAILLQEMHV
jgi:autophagy-related protein 9